MIPDTCHIRNVRIIDPAAGRDQTADLFWRDGRIVPVPRAGAPAALCIDGQGLTAVPGLLDLHVHFREPGNAAAETVASGSAAAACGGFTSVVAMPNTVPPLDRLSSVEALRARGEACGLVDVLPTGCLTRQRAGDEPADLAAMSPAVVAFTDDGSTPHDEDVLRRCMRAAQALGKPVLDHAVDAALAGAGVVREGDASRRLKLAGIPAAAEERAVERDIRLSGQTACRIHIQHVSTRGGLEQIRAARRKGLPVSGEVTPHHLALCDADIPGDDPAFKMNPPLGTADDRQALLEAVTDGTITALATDHAPHDRKTKSGGFRNAAFGVIGLETAVGVTYDVLVRSGRISVDAWIALWTTGPAAVLGLAPPSLAEGSPANVTLLAIDMPWTVRAAAFASRSRNTPFEGWTLPARAAYTFRHGRMTHGH